MMSLPFPIRIAEQKNFSTPAFFGLMVTLTGLSSGRSKFFTFSAGMSMALMLPRQ